MSGSDIAEIVDYTAVVAARIQGLVLPEGTTGGIAAIYAAGQGTYSDPLRPGELVRAVPNDERFEEWSHVSYLPEAPGIVPVTQEGLIEINWTVPMELVLPRGSLVNARALALPFYDAYLGAFWLDRTLGGLCQNAVISAFGLGRDEENRWLDIALTVTETVRYA